jgi:hypothetical protein
MRGANIIIGYVSGRQVIVEDHYGNRLTSHRPDLELGGSSDVTLLEGSENNGRTEISFRIPLNSGDEYDKPLSAGRETQIIFAWGDDGSDDVTTYHSGRGSFRVEL